jgi:phosphatidylinositol alpha-1,6-mannosyltransferase
MSSGGSPVAGLMRILMLNNEFPPLGGGTGTVNQALLQRMARMPELEIDLITSALGAEPEESQFAEKIRIFKVPVKNRIIHHSSIRELIRYALRALLLARSLQRKRPYDFCFAWSTVPAGWVARFLRKMEGLPYLVRITGPDIPGFEQRYRFIYPLLKPIILSIWRKAEVVVAKCAGETNLIRSLDGHIKITVIPNGVDPTAFEPPPSIPQEGPIRLLCVGRLIRRKGQDHLIRAVKRLVEEGYDVSLDLIGLGDEEKAYQELARGLQIENRVRFGGYVPREEIAARYHSSHIFVLPSYNEGMSVATLEAMAAGLAVLVTRTGGTPELLEEGVNGFSFAWGDVEALTNHLRHLVTHREIISEMGVASRKRAAAFSWEAASSDYRALFETVQAGFPRRFAKQKTSMGWGS